MGEAQTTEQRRLVSFIFRSFRKPLVRSSLTSSAWTEWMTSRSEEGMEWDVEVREERRAAGFLSRRKTHDGTVVTVRNGRTEWGCEWQEPPTSVTAVCLSLRLSTLRSSHLRFVPLREENGVSGVNDIRRTEVEREEGDERTRLSHERRKRERQEKWRGPWPLAPSHCVRFRFFHL